MLGVRLNFIYIFGQTSKGLEIFVVEVLRFFAINSKVYFKSINPHTIKDAEVNSFRSSTHTLINLLFRHFENPHCYTSVDIFSIFKYFYKLFIFGEYCGDTQFDL